MATHIDKEEFAVAVEKLLAAKSVVILTGAGVSKESGIPTYRDPQEGLWAKYDPRELATASGFAANPKRGWEWHNYQRQRMLQVQPNPGHVAIAEMEQLLPKVNVITQNIDGLHQAAGSVNVIELHGSIHRHKCFANCQGTPTPINLTELPPVNSSDIPLCPHCGSWVRPDVVWFEELIPDARYEATVALVDTADVLMTVGTSGAVMPASSFPYRARRWNDAFVIDVNPAANEISMYANLRLEAASGEVLPLLVQGLKLAAKQSRLV
jgi:NAD-dependent deacetylase